MWHTDGMIHRHTGGLEIIIILKHKKIVIHRHTGGLEKFTNFPP